MPVSLPYELLQHIYLLCDPEDRRKFWSFKAVGEALRETRKPIDTTLRNALEAALAAHKPHLWFMTRNRVLFDDPPEDVLFVVFHSRVLHLEQTMVYADKSRR